MDLGVNSLLNSARLGEYARRWHHRKDGGKVLLPGPNRVLIHLAGEGICPFDVPVNKQFRFDHAFSFPTIDLISVLAPDF